VEDDRATTAAMGAAHTCLTLLTSLVLAWCLSGESEAKLRALFQEAADLAPCIVFIGEPRVGPCANSLAIVAYPCQST
jgi:AAA+ superfamily predicted ATPase